MNSSSWQLQLPLAQNPLKHKNLIEEEKQIPNLGSTNPLQREKEQKSLNKPKANLGTHDTTQTEQLSAHALLNTLIDYCYVHTTRLPDRFQGLCQVRWQRVVKLYNAKPPQRAPPPHH
jgi:hypothetical protein